VRGIVRAGVVLLMARIAESAVQRVIVVSVAVSTHPRRDGVRARQLESSRRVIERGVCAEHGVVAGLARCRESRRNVVHWRGRGVVVVLVARHAGRAGQVVIVVDMTIRALPRGRRVRAAQGESSAVVVEGRIQPGSRVVALVAGLREVRRNVIRVGRSLEVFQVAGNAGRAGQVVIIVDMAIRALPWWNGVHAGEGERRRVVVE